jgi:single stranded DNA-binding protein
MTLNKIMLIGCLGDNPKINVTNGLMLYFSLATSFLSKGNKYITWHNILIYGKLAEIMKDKLFKGQKIYIEGEIRYNKKDDNINKFVHVFTKKISILKKKIDHKNSDASTSEYIDVKKKPDEKKSNSLSVTKDIFTNLFLEYHKRSSSDIAKEHVEKCLSMLSKVKI